MSNQTNKPLEDMYTNFIQKPPQSYHREVETMQNELQGLRLLSLSDSDSRLIEVLHNMKQPRVSLEKSSLPEIATYACN